jgi:hypothetical protein
MLEFLQNRKDSSREAAEPSQSPQSHLCSGQSGVTIVMLLLPSRRAWPVLSAQALLALEAPKCLHTRCPI